MKIAYFSPLPPKRTGVASYSSYLIPALTKHCEVHLFDNGAVELPAPCPLFDYVANPAYLLELDKYDSCIYHLGNNPWDHSYIYDAFLFHPSIVVLHDVVLFYLMAGRGAGALLKELCMENGPMGIEELSHILATSSERDPLRYPFPEQFPLTSRILRRAKAVIVHSETTKRLLVEARCECPIYVINMIAGGMTDHRDGADGLIDVRQQLGLPTDALLMGTFGFIGPTKRPGTIMQFLKTLRNDSPIKLVIVGQGQELTAMIRSLGVQNRVICPGFVSDAEFDKYIKAVDIVINLRYPSMGETSLTLIQAMYNAKACIVTNDAWFSELPNECLWKISPGETELEELRKAIVALSSDPGRRRSVGESARKYVLSRCMPDQVAVQYEEVFMEASASHKTNDSVYPMVRPQVVYDEAAPAAQPDSNTWLRAYFSRRVASALPPRNQS